MNKLVRNIGVFGLACMIILSGCSKKKNVEDDFEAIQGEITAEANSSDADNGSADVKSNVPKHVQYSVDTKGVGNKFIVDADVIADRPDDIGVFNMQEVTIDKDYLLNLAKKTFDNGEYTVKKPVWLCSIPELNEEKEYLDQLNQQIRQENSDVNCLDSKLYQDILDAIERNAPLENEFNIEDVILQTQVNGEPGETARIRGKINGEEYELFYINSNYYKDLSLYKIGCTPEKTAYHSPEQTAVTDNMGENECNMERAKAIADDYLLAVGLDNYELVNSYNAIGSKGLDHESFVDGYRFEYVPVVNALENAFTIFTRATTQYDPEREMKEYAEQPVVQIDIDSTGMIAVRFGKLYAIGTEVNDAVNLISFDAANEAVQSAVENTINQYNEINKIKFEYITVQYDKKYVNVPAWVYYKKTETSETIAVVACNALDGSVIFFEPSLDRYLWYD